MQTIRKIRKKTALALTLATLCAFPQSVWAYQANKTYRFTVLHVNDTHGRFWQNEQGEYGFPAQYTLIKQIKKEVAKKGGQVLLLHAGDINTGVPESDVQNARPDIEAMNHMGFDAMTLGNHEFDNPLQLLEKQEKWAKFPMISANVVHKKNQKTLTKPYVLIKKGGLKFAVVGLTTEDTAQIGNPLYIKDVQFQPAVSSAKKILNQINNNQKEKPDVRIALTHLGYDYNGKHGNNAIGDVSLARALPKNAFDLIVGGHSHTRVCMNFDGTLNQKFQAGDNCRPDYQNGSWIVQAGEWGKFLGRADFEFKNGKTKLVNYQLIPINLKKKSKDADGKNVYTLYQNEIKQDPSLTKILQPYQDNGNQLLGIKVGQTDGVFLGGSEHARREQSALGKLIAQVQMERLKADLSVMNGGSLRDTLPEGEITYKNILKVQPFGNILAYVDLTGAELLEYLKVVAMKEKGSGAFAHFSSNVSMKINQKKQTISDVQINNQAVDLNKTYRLALNNFIAAGGDAYPNVSKHPKYVETGWVDADATKAYFSEKSLIQFEDFKPKNQIIYE